MAPKYAHVDAALLTWLSNNREGVTTAGAVTALAITDPTTQRHVSRRFTQLEDRGVLRCTLDGTTRVCSVEKDPPETLARKRWSQPHPGAPVPPGASIPAADSAAYEAAGGIIERLPSLFDRPARGSQPLGPHTLLDSLSTD